MTPLPAGANEVELLDEEYQHHLRRGTELLARGDHGAAIAALTRARALRPSDTGVVGLLGQALYKHGRFDEAAEAFEAVVEASPGEPGPRVNLGLARLKAKNHPEAIRHLELAVELQPGNQRALGYLGLAWLEQGDAARARACFVRAGNDAMVARCDELVAQAADGAERASEPDAIAVTVTPEAEALALVPPLSLDAPAPFAIEHGFVVTRVSGDVLVRADGIAAIRGQVRMAAAQEQHRGDAVHRPFGAGARRMLRGSGTGSVLHAIAERRISRLALDGQRPACLCDAVVLAFEGSLAYENGRVASRLGTDLDLVQLRGRGEVLLVSRGPLALVPVAPDAPVRVLVALLAGWLGTLTPHFGALIEVEGEGARTDQAPLAVELSGTGHVLVEGAPA